jgi:hypothetical protein
MDAISLLFFTCGLGAGFATGFAAAVTFAAAPCLAAGFTGVLDF